LPAYLLSYLPTFKKDLWNMFFPLRNVFKNFQNIVLEIKLPMSRRSTTCPIQHECGCIQKGQTQKESTWEQLLFDAFCSGFRVYVLDRQNVCPWRTQVMGSGFQKNDSLYYITMLTDHVGLYSKRHPNHVKLVRLTSQVPSNGALNGSLDPFSIFYESFWMFARF